MSNIVRDLLPWYFKKPEEVKKLETESKRIDQAYADLERTINDVTKALERQNE